MMADGEKTPRKVLFQETHISYRPSAMVPLEGLGVVYIDSRDIILAAFADV